MRPSGSFRCIRSNRTLASPSGGLRWARRSGARGCSSPPPTTVEGFERFIAWTHRERVAGNYVCFGIVPEGIDATIGLFQVHSLQSDFGIAEWGFAMGSPFWGTGLFVAAATLVINFAVDVLGVQRLEARAVVANGRGNGALRKLGAVQEGVLRRSFLRHGHYYDQVLWSILAADWRLQSPGEYPVIH